MSNVFNDLHVDPIEGSIIMNKLGISPYDLSDSNTFSRVMDIMGYFQGKEDKEFILDKILVGKNVTNKVDHVWGYTSLRRQYDEYQKQADRLKEQLFYYER